MSENLNPFDTHFRQRLTDLESSVPDDLFDRLQARRGAALPSDAPLRERMSAHEMPVSDGFFDAILAERERQKRRRIVLWRSVTAVAAALLLLFVAIEFKNKNTISVDKLAQLNGVNSVKNDVNKDELNTQKIVDNAVNNSTLNGVKTVDNNATPSDFNNNKTIENSENTEGGNSELKIKNSKLNTPNSELKIKNSKLNTPNSELKIKNSKLNTPHSELKIKNSKLNKLNSELEISNSELNKANGLVNNSTKKQQIVINKKSNFNSDKNVVNNQKNAKTQSNNVIASAISDNSANKNVKLNSLNSNLNNIRTDELNTIKANGNNVINSGIRNNNSELNSNKTLENSLNTEGGNSELMDKNNASKIVLENRLSSPNFSTSTLDLLDILSVKTVALPTKSRKNPCSDPGSNCPTFIGKRRMNQIQYYVDAFVAPEYMMRRFATNLPESEKLLAARDSNEKVQYAVSTGVRGSVVFGNGISLRAGLVYTQMNERVQFDSFGIGNIKTTYDVQIINGKPDTVSITTVITDGIFRKTRYNRYRSLDIPIQIGYQMPLKNGWTLGFNGGANVNITAWQKADIFGANLQQQTVSSGINEVNPVFRTQLGVSLIGSVAVYRQLTNRLELMIEPSVRYGLQPITRSDYALKQHYSTAGLIVGLRFLL